MPHYLRSRVFLALVLTQILAAIGTMWATYTLHSSHRNSLEQHATLHKYRRQLQAISTRLQETSTKSVQRRDEARKALARVAQDAIAAVADWPVDSSTDQDDSSRAFDPAELNAIETSAQKLSAEAANTAADIASQQRLEEARVRLLAAVQQVAQDVNALEAPALESLAAEARADDWIEVLEAITFLLILATVVYVAQLEHARRAQVATREATELELRRERSTLERRVNERTAELQTEVKERRRAEQLNKGRSRVLEMLVRDEPTQKILEALVETVAGHRSIWACALHLLEGESMRLVAQCNLPNTLKARLENITCKMADAPEFSALTGEGVHVLPDLNQEHKPWIELLRANGAQSAWSAPFLVGGKPLGTMTIYTLLLSPPADVDIELLKMSCQMASLILERQHMNEELIHRAYHDALTGLGNRRLGKKGLDGAIQRSQASGTGVGVLWIDLNKFKQINDTYGHSAGDYVLQEMAGRLSARLRTGDTLARMGGDEFMVVLEGIENRGVAEHIASDLHKLLAVPIQMEAQQFNVTASIGVSFYPEDGNSADTLEQCADVAMYEAKFKGFGVRSFTPVLTEELSERRMLEVEMTRALEHGGFSLVYQPQCTAEGRVAAFEALLRFEHPQLGSVPPSRFIPIAEEMKLILPLGRWVLKEVCRQLRLWQDAGYPIVPVAVNISSLQFMRDDFSDEVAEILTDAKVPPSLLELELTEGLVMKDFAESARQMQKLKDLGVRIAIDDFGTGYSSLSYLHRLPIDALKIDRSFVEMINEPDGTLPIVEAVISMAQALGLRVVGEGVETVAQMEALRNGGCEILQGYLFSRPVSASEAAQLLEDKVPQSQSKRANTRNSLLTDNDRVRFIRFLNTAS